MKLEIPKSEKKEWRGIYPGNDKGHLWQTFNIDLERLDGKLCLSGLPALVDKSDSDLTFGVPLKWVRVNVDGTDRYYCLTSTKLIKSTNSLPTSVYLSDSNANSPTNSLYDMIVHGDSDHSDTNSSDRLLVTYNTGIAIMNKISALKAWDTDWWTAASGDTNDTSGLGQSAMKATDHPLGKLQTLVAVGDGNRLHTIDRNDVVVANRLTFPLGFSCFLILNSPEKFWIALTPDAGNNGKILEWDGSTVTYNREYPFIGIPITGWVKDGVPYFINHYGQIMGFNGEGFEEVQRFPLDEENLVFGAPYVSGGFGISRYGCTIDKDIIKIFVSGWNYSRRVRAGIWVFNPKNKNLYHHKAVGSGLGDFGQGFVYLAGGLEKVSGSSTDVIAGVLYHLSYGTTTQSAIVKFGQNRTKNDATNRGYFITPYLSTSDIVDFWRNLWIKFRNFVHNDNKIIVKFRTQEPITYLGDLLTCSITWVSFTSFKGTLPTGVKIGDEVEILAGVNGGRLFHISALSATPNGALTITVTLDESGDTDYTDTSVGLAVFENWTKCDVLSDTSIGSYNFPLTGSDSDGNPLNNGENCQLKVELRGKAMEVDQIIAIAKEAIEPE